MHDHEQRVGLIGIGLLGMAIAERLIKHSFQVTGYDPQVSERFTSLGGQRADSAQEVFSVCDRTILCLPNSDIVRQVIDAADSSLRSGQVIVDTTTGSPVAAKRMGALLQARRIAYLDATVSGSSQQMRAGVATLLIGGQADHLAQCEDIVSALSQKHFHLGSVGSGAKMKLITNLAIGLNRAVLGEALALGESCGFDSLHVLEILRSTPAHSAAMDTKGQKMATSDFAVQARLRQHLKDVQLILELAQDENAHVPLSTLHETLLSDLVKAGKGEFDNSAIVEAFRKQR